MRYQDRRGDPPVVMEESGARSELYDSHKTGVKLQHEWQHVSTYVYPFVMPLRSDGLETGVKVGKGQDRFVGTKKGAINIETRRSSTLEKRVILVQGPC